MSSTFKYEKKERKLRLQLESLCWQREENLKVIDARNREYSQLFGGNELCFDYSTVFILQNNEDIINSLENREFSNEKILQKTEAAKQFVDQFQKLHPSLNPSDLSFLTPENTKASKKKLESVAREYENLLNIKNSIELDILRNQRIH